MQKKILIVEDDPLILGMYKVKFQNAGYIVVFARDGVGGIETLHDESPDVILTDWMMPKMNGEEMIRNLRKKDGCDVPIVVVTNSSLEGDEEIAKKIGVDSFLIKADCTPALVLEKVEESLKN